MALHQTPSPPGDKPYASGAWLPTPLRAFASCPMLCDPPGEVGLVSTSSLISFVPRQVMLEGSAARSDSAALADKSKKRRKKREEKRSNSPHVTAALVRAIASFLEGNGFSRTLTALRSEAQLEVDDGCKAPLLDLKDMVRKYLERSDDDAAVGKADNQREQVEVVQYSVPQEEKEACVQDHHEKPVSKKKKRKSKEAGDQVEVVSEEFASENGVVLQNEVKEALSERKALPVELATAESQLPESCVNKSKDQKKKKSEVSDETINPVEERVESVCPLPDNASNLLLKSSDRSKDKKKSDRKKKKEEEKKSSKSTSDEITNDVGYMISQEEEGKTDSQITASLSENVSSHTPGEDTSAKGRDKKKRKHKLIEGSSGYEAEMQYGIKSETNKKEKHINLASKGGTVESEPMIKNVSPSGSMKVKKRKNLPSEEPVLQIDSGASVEDAERRRPDLDLLSNGEDHFPAKIGQTEQTEVQINENHGKNELERNGSLKSSKSELKNLTPKTVNAFQRVKVDAVKFADNRLQDNSYWAKAGAETGYGAKAQEILGQVRGRDFRHEKTKKKRGSYRGGQIDFQSHSVKFQYSDEDE